MQLISEFSSFVLLIIIERIISTLLDRYFRQHSKYFDFGVFSKPIIIFGFILIGFNYLSVRV